MIKSKKREECCSIKSFSLSFSRNNDIQVQTTIQNIEKWISSFKDMDFKIQTLNIINNSIVITYSYRKIICNEKNKKLKMELDFKDNKNLQKLFQKPNELESDETLSKLKEINKSFSLINESLKGNHRRIYKNVNDVEDHIFNFEDENGDEFF